MLQQILRDMYVEPEILAELDDAQKQTLFCKMREQQVVRWRAWDEQVTAEEAARGRGGQTRAASGKTVQFLQGEDGEPWVWVMGEHEDDKSIESILLEEAEKKATELALREAEQLRQSVERELTSLIQPLECQKFDISPKQAELEEALEIYCTVDELRQRMSQEQYCNERNKQNRHFHFVEGKRDSLQELGIPEACKDGGVSNRVAAWERRVASARAEEILRDMRQRRARHARDAEQFARDTDITWREQERKAREAEQQMRQIARTAREQHRRSVTVSNCAPASQQALAEKPPSREAIVEWFGEREAGRGAGRDEAGRAADWFHGLITRCEAEAILMPEPEGSFLVRVSEKIWGYAISYRAPDKCKHYLVEATAPDSYRFLGDNQLAHTSLAELVTYHKKHPITESGGELLRQACPAPQTPAILLPAP